MEESRTSAGSGRTVGEEVWVGSVGESSGGTRASQGVLGVSGTVGRTFEGYSRSFWKDFVLGPVPGTKYSDGE